MGLSYAGIANMTNKETAKQFLTLASKGQVDEAYSSFVGPSFRHHNPWYKGDAESLKRGMAENAAANPDKVFEIQRAIHEGDLVAVHSRVRQKPDQPGAVVVHIFRFENGKIVELWDLGQAVPESTINENGIL